MKESTHYASLPKQWELASTLRRHIHYGATTHIPHTFCFSYPASVSRLARIVVPGCPHHVTQRGNWLQPIFFEDGDQEVYRDRLAEQLTRRRVEIWAYCLMRKRHPRSTPAWAQDLAFRAKVALAGFLRRAMRLRAILRISSSMVRGL